MASSVIFFMFNIMFIMILAMIPVVIVLRIVEFLMKRTTRVRKHF